MRAILVVLCTCMLFPAMSVAAESSPSSGVRTGAPTHTDLVARIKQGIEEGRPLQFSPVFLAVWRTDSGVVVTTSSSDPLMPETLEVYFDDWHVSARANLLLDYVRWYEAPTTAVDVQSVDEQLRLERAWQTHARIRHIVTRGGYERDWLPFRTAYAKFAAEVEGVAVDSRKPQRVEMKDPVAAFAPGNKLAQDLGVFRLIEDLRIDPDDVAEEMLRLVSEARERMGGEAALASNLLYTCMSPKSSEASAYPLAGVRVSARHELAPAFFKALQTEKDDSQAKAVMEVYRQIGAKFGAWREEHAEVGSSEEGAKLRELASSHDFEEVLKKFSNP